MESVVRKVKPTPMIESAEEFVRLRCSDDPDLYLRATHESAPEHVWREVIEKYPKMRCWVAHNKTVPHSILEVLANDPDPKVRYFVAMKRKISPLLCKRLATDPDESVRLAIARNEKDPDKYPSKVG